MNTPLMRIVLVVVASTVTFVAGWFVSRSFYGGELAMGSLIETVSVISYLQKDDKANAMKLLLLSAEGDVVRVADYGTPVLSWYEPETKRAFIRRYARIRDSHPQVEYPDGGAFKEKVDASLRQLLGAEQGTSTAREK